MKVAGITKDASIIGRGKYLEIWNTKKFEEYASGEEYDEMFYNLVPLQK